VEDSVDLPSAFQRTLTGTCVERNSTYQIQCSF